MLLNLEPDHLDRHGTFEWYATRSCGSSSSRPRTTSRSSRAASARFPGGATRVEFAGDDPLPAEPLIPGAHNRENAAAATAAARAAGLPDEAIADALRTFPGVEHRIEQVRELRGVRYVNDSKATNVAAALRAVAALRPARLHVDPRRPRQERELRAARRRARAGTTART